MGGAPLISSQRHLDRKKVAVKAFSFQVFIVRVADVTLRGKPYRVIIDGHHNLAAAKMAGETPTWRGPNAKWKRIREQMGAADFERFLINNLTDSDWYYVDTGLVVDELLAAATGEKP
ncbi:hypothetical protein ACUXAV_000425 [Cupriavidus metallidurans]|uniref:hypothetical protein n=1 Tax=Cupriavidus metallidurans TaxID=119219 RepID=UPI000492F146|nr:hypothetical protein [Cupriavidus metallidurans]MDE4918383.1 hypothetical protein [Cupriavidus metallidurans]